MVLVEDLADFLDTRCIPDERGCNKVNILLNAEDNICLVFLCDSRKLHSYIRYIDALFLAQLTAVCNGADNVIFFYGLYIQLDKAVINEDLVARFDFSCQPGISDGTSFFITHRLFHIESKICALCQSDFLSVLQNPGTNFRAFGIQKNSNRFIQLLPDIFQQVHTVSLLLVIPV